MGINIQGQHDKCLTAALSKISDSGLTSVERNVFRVTKTSFLGQPVDIDCIKPNQKKGQAVNEMFENTSTELLDMINQLSKFSPHLSNKTQLLRLLLSSKNHWS